MPRVIDRADRFVCGSIQWHAALGRDEVLETRQWPLSLENRGITSDLDRITGGRHIRLLKRHQSVLVDVVEEEWTAHLLRLFQNPEAVGVIKAKDAGDVGGRD